VSLKRANSPLIFFNDKYNIIYEKNIREFIIQMNIRSTHKQILIVRLNKRQKQNKIRREKKKKTTRCLKLDVENSNKIERELCNL
jgi:hypothetical protein